MELARKNQVLTSLVELLQTESLPPSPGPASAAGEDSSSQWPAALAAEGALVPAERKLMQQLAQALMAQRQLQCQLMEGAEGYNAETTQHSSTTNASSDGQTDHPAATEALTQTADSVDPESPAAPGSGLPSYGKLAQLVSGTRALFGSKALPAASQHTHPEEEGAPLSTTTTNSSELNLTAEGGPECSNAAPVAVTPTPASAAVLGAQQDGSSRGQHGRQMLEERINELQKEVGSPALNLTKGSLLQQPGRNVSLST